MSSEGIPLKSDVMNWSSATLAGFFSKRRDLAGCDKVILNHNIDGQRFLSMSENDLQKFPKVLLPIVSKISCEINENVAKKGIFKRQPVAKFVQEVQPVGWGDSDFDSDDDEYESPNSGGDSDYESPTNGPDDQEHADSDYEPPPSEKHEAVHSICAAKPIPDSEYIDDNRGRDFSRNRQPPVPPERPGPGPSLPFRPNIRSKADQSPQRPIFRPPNNMLQGSAAPAVDRSKKPSTLERPAPATKRASVNRPSVPDKDVFGKPPLPGPGVQRSVSAAGRNSSSPFRPAAGDFKNEEPMPRPPFSSNTFPLPRNPSPRPSPPGSLADSWPSSGGSGGSRSSQSLPPHLQEVKNSRTGPPQRTHDPGQDMDSAWYLGRVTRGQAESRLWGINMDGAFLVRDSSKGSATQPYTLMVLYQNKVYNIQIRYDAHQHAFLLGTGLKATERFPTVRDIIENYHHMPLLLIDAKNRGSGQQNQCPLIHPAGH